ncbi:hypothetical protein B0H17DRAFT_1216893 [Mycena rosella]|uniref:Uncharacterized protein n=1 Tax=Mycena rosella TaxID=1033263 RepID=A0AAD7C375_MYCRO|nr:hypothetical protein B0H17DRAFT_1216893 [Mycena rosella]
MFAWNKIFVGSRGQPIKGGWVVEGIPATSAIDTPVHVYSAGDTGYCSVMLPVCPAFKEISTHWGAFNLALASGAPPPPSLSPHIRTLPIHVTIHCMLRNSIALFRNIRTCHTLGMHWCAWVLTTEDILEPLLRLAEECTKADMATRTFGVCAIGETVRVEVGGVRAPLECTPSNTEVHSTFPAPAPVSKS